MCYSNYAKTIKKVVTNVNTFSILRSYRNTDMSNIGNIPPDIISYIYPRIITIRVPTEVVNRISNFLNSKGPCSLTSL